MLATKSVAMSDFDDLVEIRIEAMKESLERLGRFDPDRARKRLVDGFRLEATEHLLDGETEVGFWMACEQDDAWVLDHLYIRPRFQGKGYGAMAMEILFERASNSAKGIRLMALKGSRSNDFYIRHGFALQHADEFDNHYFRPFAS